METHDFFLYLLVILLTVRLFTELATRLQTPAVIGELFAGVVLGASLLGWIEPVEAIKWMAEIGIILLLFEVGLETDIKRLVRTGMKSFVVAIAGFVVPLIFGLGKAGPDIPNDIESQVRSLSVEETAGLCCGI